MNAAPVQSLDRGLEILERVAASENGVTLSELAAALNVAMPTAFSLAGTLVGRGYLEKGKRPIRYLLGSRVQALAKQETGSARQPGSFAAGVLALRGELGADSVLHTKWIRGECMKATLVEAVRPDVVQFPQTLIDSPYSMATTLCVMAFLSDEDRRAYERRYPFEEYGARLWDSRGVLNAFFTEVRTAGFCLPPQQEEVGRVALPLWGSGNQLIGSLGASFMDSLTPGSPRTAQVLRALKQTVSEVGTPS
jgi:DNA-binding IclR family transcriptional regulator